MTLKIENKYAPSLWGTNDEENEFEAFAKQNLTRIKLFYLSDTFAQTQIHPILGYTFNKKWSVAIGDAQYTYDWKKDRMTSIPLSGQLNHILPIEKHDSFVFQGPVRIEAAVRRRQMEPQHRVHAGCEAIGKQP